MKTLTYAAKTSRDMLLYKVGGCSRYLPDNVLHHHTPDGVFALTESTSAQCSLVAQQRR